MPRYRSPTSLMVTIALAQIGTAGLAHAQESTIVPGDGTLRVEALRPFEAEYEQMGHRFSVRMERTSEARPVWSFQMIMNTPRGIMIDHVGHFADDLAFAYRRFSFRAFRDEYLEATASSEQLTVRRLFREEVPENPPATTVTPLDTPVLDGAFLYWALALLPESEGQAWRFRTWSPTSDAAVLRLSASLRVVGRETITLEDGAQFAARTMVADGTAGKMTMWVTDSPPYLLRQEMETLDGTVTTVIDLKQLRIQRPDDR